MTRNQKRWIDYRDKLRAAAAVMGKQWYKLHLGSPEYKCECPRCERTRRTGANFRRRRKGLPDLPPITTPPAKGCTCEPCVKRREEMRQARANGYDWRARRTLQSHPGPQASTEGAQGGQIDAR